MTTATETLARLRRPRLLMSAARHGASDYSRSRCLARILRVDTAPSPACAVDALLAQEAEVEQERREGKASYSVARHIDLLIALLGEARLAARAAA